MPATQTAQMHRLRNRLDDILQAHNLLEEVDEDAPFVIYLTERMLRDIEACRKTCESLKQATWPSLN